MDTIWAVLEGMGGKEEDSISKDLKLRKLQYTKYRSFSGVRT